jgi:hypothetical protein
MEFLTDALIAQAINGLGETFDAHQVEAALLRTDAGAFARELLRCETRDDPLLRFSAEFSRHIDRRFQNQIRRAEKVGSRNLGGQVSKSQQWIKLSGPVHP